MGVALACCICDGDCTQGALRTVSSTEAIERAHQESRATYAVVGGASRGSVSREAPPRPASQSDRSDSPQFTTAHDEEIMLALEREVELTPELSSTLAGPAAPGGPRRPDLPIRSPATLPPRPPPQPLQQEDDQQQQQRWSRRRGIQAAPAAALPGSGTAGILRALGQGFSTGPPRSNIMAGVGGQSIGGPRPARLPPDLLLRWGVVPDVDRMSYEELLELGERIGNVRTRPRICKEQLAPLPTRIASDRECQVDDLGKAAPSNSCAVCCEAYVRGEELRTLPCFHSFHTQCIDQWLLSDMPGATKCPVCHHEVPL